MPGSALGLQSDITGPACLSRVVRQLNHEEPEEEETSSTTASFCGQSSTATKTNG
jgi:hypothetical protein